MEKLPVSGAFSASVGIGINSESGIAGCDVNGLICADVDGPGDVDGPIRDERRDGANLILNIPDD